MIELEIYCAEEAPDFVKNARFEIGQRVRLLRRPSITGTVIALCKSGNSCGVSIGVEHDTWRSGHNLRNCNNKQWPEDAEAAPGAGWWYGQESLEVIE